MTRLIFVFLLFTSLAASSFAEGARERLLLVTNDDSRGAAVEVGLMKPFELLLVAERDSENPQISTVVFTLDIPEGLLLVGEEILTESLIALGTPRTGINLSFLCVETASIDVMRFRFLATKPLESALVSLLPDTRTNFRGIVSCSDENYDKWDTDLSGVEITAR